MFSINNSIPFYSAAGFEVQKVEKSQILKGDKDLAKDRPDIPTASSAVERHVSVKI